MSDDLAGLVEEFEWNLTQADSKDTPQEARIRLRGGHVYDLLYRTPVDLTPKRSPIPVMRITRSSLQ